MLIDCHTCEARGDACGDCVVTVLLGPPRFLAGGTDVDEVEVRALAVLADGGLVPHLRHRSAASVGDAGTTVPDGPGHAVHPAAASG